MIVLEVGLNRGPLKHRLQSSCWLVDCNEMPSKFKIPKIQIRVKHIYFMITKNIDKLKVHKDITNNFSFLRNQLDWKINLSCQTI